MLHIGGFFITCNGIILNNYNMSHMLDLTGKQILSEFGKGIGMPGSGSVAVLSVLSGTQLLVSVCKLTVAKKSYKDVHDDIAEVQQKLEKDFIPKLESIMDRDAKVVKEMLKYRIARDRETDPDKKEEYKQKALEILEHATDTMMELCATCLDIIPMALHAYRIGLISAQGDSGVVLSNILSGASSGLYMTLINLQAAGNSEWTTGKRSEVEIFFGRLHEYQYIHNGRLAALYNKT